MKCFLFAFFVYIQFRSIGFLGRLYLLLPHKFHLDQMAKITFRGHGILQSIHHPSLYNNKLFSAPILLPPKLPSVKLYNLSKRDNLSSSLRISPSFTANFTLLYLSIVFFFSLLTGRFWHLRSDVLGIKILPGLPSKSFVQL